MNTSGSPGQTTYTTVPNLVYGYDSGGTSPRNNALLYQLENDAAQAEIASLGGGKMSRRSRRRHRKNRRGGQAAGTEMEVPSFPQAGPATSPLNATSASVAANQAALDAQVSACGDCHATNTCDQTLGCPQQGGRTRRHRSVRRRPFAISTRRVKLSPFKNAASVRKTLKAYKSGRKIGFTQRSSLRSMGLIKRKDGKYALGAKYSRV